MPAVKAPPPIYQLKITLLDIEPPIWRRIQVPATILLCCFHDALQAVFGWTHSHLHSFEKDGKYWGVPEYDDLIDESKVQLAKLLKAEGASMIYVYDFGDNWRHEVLLEKSIPANAPLKIPICLDGARHCPPEDVGGVSGYQEFLEVIFDPGFVKIRHFGFLANRNRSVRLNLCRELLNAPVSSDATAGLLTNKQKHAAERRCPSCQIGTLWVVERLSFEDLLILRKAATRGYQIDSS